MKSKTILITGITGTLGTELTRQLLKTKHTILGLSRDEYKQSIFKYRDKVRLFIGDIKDISSFYPIPPVDLIIHCAALKHVSEGEFFPLEFIKTNIIGTQNLCLYQKTHSIPRVVFISTDKACMPINVYGATKLLGERIVLQASKNNVVVRYGNVFNSRGSIFDKLLNSQRIHVANSKMTRFWINIETAAKYILFWALKEGLPKKQIRIPKMYSSSLGDIINAFCHVNKIKKEKCTFSSSGKEERRAMEKLHECIDYTEEGSTVSSDTNKYFLSLDVNKDRLYAFTKIEETK